MIICCTFNEVIKTKVRIKGHCGTLTGSVVYSFLGQAYIVIELVIVYTWGFCRPFSYGIPFSIIVPSILSFHPQFLSLFHLYYQKYIIYVWLLASSRYSNAMAGIQQVYKVRVYTPTFFLYLSLSLSVGCWSWFESALRPRILVQFQA